MRYTEADLVKLPGLEIVENGHYFDSPTGRVFIENAHPLDELFGGDIFGLLNVSAANRKVVGLQTQTIPIDAGLRRNISRNEYSHAVVRNMTVERRDEPILMLVSSDGVYVIDGTHRLKRRMRDRLPTVDAYILRPETVRPMRVRMFRQVDGEWKQEAGLTDEQMEQMIVSANLFKTLAAGK